MSPSQPSRPIQPSRTVQPLRPARPDDLATVLAWVPDAPACRRWAGPDLRFPATPASAWADMHETPAQTFVLLDAGDVLAGFGQLLPRPHRTQHLARLIVAPRRRGEGLGRRLCQALIDEARERFAVRRLTLNVYPDNAAALALYASLGFAPSADAAPSGTLPMAWELPRSVR